MLPTDDPSPMTSADLENIRRQIEIKDRWLELLAKYRITEDDCPGWHKTLSLDDPLADQASKIIPGFKNDPVDVMEWLSDLLSNVPEGVWGQAAVEAVRDQIDSWVEEADDAEDKD
jgi:hypothetical protein